MQKDQANSPPYTEKFFGRRKGRPLGDQTIALVKKVLPHIQLNPEFGKGPVHPSTFFDAPKTGYALEIGFGGGEHLAYRAMQSTSWGFIGVEVFFNGVASLLQLIEENELANVRVYPEDVRPFLEYLESSSLDQIYVLFPDPWPKARHHGRRMVQQERITRFAQLLKPGGNLYLATDVPDYLMWMEEIMASHPDFCLQNTYTTATKPADWPLTRYEEKAQKKGRSGTYLVFERA